MPTDDDAIAKACPRGAWHMAIVTPALASHPRPRIFSEMEGISGWTSRAVGDRYAFVQALRPSPWQPGVHQAVAHELMLAMVPGVGPNLVGHIALEEIRVIDPTGQVRAWDLEEVDPKRYLRNAWRPSNTGQAANFLANAAATPSSLEFGAVTVEDSGYEMAGGSSIAEEFFGR